MPEERRRFRVLRIVICDDNAEILDCLQEWICAQFSPERVKLFSFASAKDLAEAVAQGLRADIAILDILLGKENGIALAKQLFPSAAQTQVIFITGYVEYCSAVYETEHIYFLLKPLQRQAFQQAMDKALRAWQNARKGELLVQTKRSIQRIPFTSIRYLESMGRKVRLYCQDEVVECYATLSVLANDLPGCFVSCHKSFLVNLDYVKKMEANQFVLTGNEEIPISQAKRGHAKRCFLDYVSRRF